jgi:hypothetical protein
LLLWLINFTPFVRASRSAAELTSIRFRYEGLRLILWRWIDKTYFRFGNYFGSFVKLFFREKSSFENSVDYIDDCDNIDNGDNIDVGCFQSEQASSRHLFSKTIVNADCPDPQTFGYDTRELIPHWLFLFFDIEMKPLLPHDVAQEF